MSVIWTPLGTRQLVRFYDPNNPSNVFSPQNNAATQVTKVGNVRKWTMTTNGTAVFTGGAEYPPKEVTLRWNMLDSTDYNSLRAFTTINPLVMVDNNDQGYFGALLLDNPGQVNGVTGNVYSVDASFLVLKPYNGLNTTINTLAAPALATTTQTTGGYITGNTTLYFWVTVFTKWGESKVGPAYTVTVPAGTNTNYILLSFASPSSTYYRKTRIYWNNVNSSLTATLLADVFAGFTGTIPVFGNYANYNTLNPPTINLAFTGTWQGGRWSNGT